MISMMLQWMRFSVALAGHYGGIDRLLRRLRGPGLVILMFHRLREEPDPYPLSISPDSFRRITRWLDQQGLLVSLDGGIQHLSEPSARGVRYALTFDDGYRDNLRLTDHELRHVPAVVYVTTDLVGGQALWPYQLVDLVEYRQRHRLDLHALDLGEFDLDDPGHRDRLYAELPARLKQLEPDAMQACLENIAEQLAPDPAYRQCRHMLDWADVRRLRDRGIAIGGHTRHHVLLSRVGDARARIEITGCFNRLLCELGAPPQHFAYPNGRAEDFSERDIELVQAAGYRTAVSTIEGINRPDTDRYRLMRHNVHEGRFCTPWGRLSRAMFFSETSGLLGLLKMFRRN